MSSRAIGELSITEIEAPTLVKLIRAIEDRGVHDIAKRALETIGQVYRYAIAHGLSSRNPAAAYMIVVNAWSPIFIFQLT